MIIKPFNWKLFFILLAACLAGTLAVLPYALELQAPALESMPPLPWTILIPIQVLQTLVLFGIAIAAGLWAANRIGLGLPILEDALARRPVRRQLLNILPLSVVVGVAASALIILLEIFFFQPRLAAGLRDGTAALDLINAPPSAWKGLLASLYGGINEEVLLRLGLMSILAWLGGLVARAPDQHPAPAVFWIANVLAAVLFGLGHLPATAVLIPLTPLVIARAVVLNGLAGIGFGWLYWKHGLEAAMLAHFSADLVLHVLLAF